MSKGSSEKKIMTYIHVKQELTQKNGGQNGTVF